MDVSSEHVLLSYRELKYANAVKVKIVPRDLPCGSHFTLKYYLVDSSLSVTSVLSFAVSTVQHELTNIKSFARNILDI